MKEKAEQMHGEAVDNEVGKDQYVEKVAARMARADLD